MAFSRRDKLIAVFEDTMKQIADNPALAKAAKNSIINARYYAPDDYPIFESEVDFTGEIAVTRHSSFEADE